MKKNKYFTLAAAVLFTQMLFSQQTETRKLSAFSKLYLSGTLDALVQKGTEESVKIVAKGIGTARIITEISDNDLHIYIEDGDYRDINVKVYVTYKEIAAVDLAGPANLEWLSELSVSDFNFWMHDSGNCNFKDKVKTALFNLVKTGSGNLNITSLESTEAKFSVSGSGKLNIENGSVKKQTVELSGTATVVAPGLKSEQCNATVSGSGNIEVSVSGMLEGKISGSGNIIYNGNAQVNKKLITGSGKITKRY